MHDANGLLSTEGWLVISLCGVVLLAMGCVLLAYYAVVAYAEDRDAMAQEAALSAARLDDAERCDDATAVPVLSQVRRDLQRDLARREAARVQRLRVESRESRPVPPAAA